MSALSIVSTERATRRLAVAWMILVAAVALHVTDEALTGFLSVYNPTVLELHQRVPWLRPPTFTYEAWLTMLIIGLCFALLLTPLALNFPRGFRAVAIIGAILMILNGCGHLLGTLLGHTFSDIRFTRPMPGTYSSPTMIAAAVYLILSTRSRIAGSATSRERSLTI